MTDFNKFMEKVHANISEIKDIPIEEMKSDFNQSRSLAAVGFAIASLHSALRNVEIGDRVMADVYLDWLKIQEDIKIKCPDCGHKFKMT